MSDNAITAVTAGETTVPAVTVPHVDVTVTFRVVPLAGSTVMPAAETVADAVAALVRDQVRSGGRNGGVTLYQGGYYSGAPIGLLTMPPAAE